ncbi:MAG: hypothetical protein QY318_02005 [Candidatus Dojkabacteria bacterium]|nr:MAG: hypothetical protein QY318_02005 [Candidatus Dojkabacteria bacterium]
MAIEKDQKIIEQVESIKDSKKKVYGFTVFTFIVVIICVVFAIRPSVATIIRVQSEIKTKRQYKEQLEAKINAIGSLYAQFTQFEDTAKEVTLIFPHTGDFSLFMSNIEGLAEKNNFVLNNISFDEPDREPPIQTVVLENWRANITVIGKEEDIIPFMKDIEAMPMYPIIDKITYSTEEDSDGNIRASISILIYKIDDPLFYE